MNGRSVVLVYHALGRERAGLHPLRAFVDVEEFARQMDFLARRRRVVALEEILLEAADEGPPRVAITFDDAYRSVLEHALPVLQQHRFPATVFVPTAWIGDRNRWDAAQPGVDRDLMSERELLELRELGFAVESHGHRHIDMSRASEQEVREDIASSVSRLRELLGEAPRFLAYPYGRSSAAARRIASETGFAEAFALEFEDAAFARSRTPIFPHDSGWRYALKSTGHYARFRRSRAVALPYARLVRPLRRRR